MKYLTILLFLLPFKMVMAQQRATIQLLAEAEIRLNPKNAAYDPPKAFAIYEETAAKGNQKAMNALGILYSEGRGTQVDTTLSVQWFKRAAEAGYSLAWYNLGELYKKGLGVKQNFVTAYHYYQKGSAARAPNGYYGEGFMRYKGLGCEQSYSEAFKLFQLGIPRGSISSMYMLALCYRNGYGTVAKLDSARYWLSKAAAANYPLAVDEMKVSAPENPEFASSGTVQKKSPKVKQEKDFSTFRSIRHHVPKSDVAGNYSGHIIRYDWSGQHVIGKSKLTLTLSQSTSLLTGIWQEEDGSSVPFSAQLTDTSLVFSNTSYERIDHYNQEKPVRFEFRNAILQVIKTQDSVLLAGNLQLWSVNLNEPEKPIFISLARNSGEFQAGKGRVLNDLSVQDSLITGFIAYPNPFENAFQVQFTTLQKVSVAISLTDALTGRTVYKEDRKLLTPGKQSMPIRAELPPGIFILRMVYGQKIKSTLMVRQ